MIKWSAQALMDLQEHLEFLRNIEHHNPEVVIAEIYHSTEQLPLNPEIGKKISEETYQLVIADPKYVVYYSIDEQITIVRVFHRRQKREI